MRTLYSPSNLPDAMSLAKLVEGKCNAQRLFFQQSRPLFFKPPTSPLLPCSTPSPACPSPLPIKRLTLAKMTARREKNLCFKCDERFTPGHLCQPAQFLCLFADLEDEHPPDPGPPCPDNTPEHPAMPEELHVIDNPCISYHALTGQVVPSTLKLIGTINGKEIIVLVDGGSTNNFVQSQLVSHLGLAVEPSSHLRVIVGNGDALHCTCVWS